MTCLHPKLQTLSRKRPILGAASIREGREEYAQPQTARSHKPKIMSIFRARAAVLLPVLGDQPGTSRGCLQGWVARPALVSFRPA